MQKGKFYTINDYTITRAGKIINSHNGRIVKAQPNGKGYLRVSIGKKKLFVHRLVAEKYIPNPENKEQVNHIDGDKNNNSVENLEWVTNQENRNHAMKNGLHRCGEDCNFAKLTKKDVEFIRNHPEMTTKSLVDIFKVSRGTINGVRKFRTWKNS